MLTHSGSVRSVRGLSREPTSSSSTFAPSFIKTEDMRKHTDIVKGIEGENDFSGKKYVWLKDPQTAFVKGWVVEELAGNRLLVQCDDGSVSVALDDDAGSRCALTAGTSNARLMPRVWTRSTRPSSTRSATWPS